MWTAFGVIAVLGGIGGVAWIIRTWCCEPFDTSATAFMYELWYVAYTHPTLPDDCNGAVWKVLAGSPDDALTQFKKYMCGVKHKVLCCTKDYGFACERLLHD